MILIDPVIESDKINNEPKDLQFGWTTFRPRVIQLSRNYIKRETIHPFTQTLLVNGGTTYPNHTLKA